MRLELPIRWTEEDKEAEKLSDILAKEVTPSEKKYTHGRLSIDSEDIGEYYDIDDRYIMLNSKESGKIYCVAVPFDEFKKIFTEVTGKAILALQTREEYKSNKRKKKGDDDIDNILNG